jgi:hypothetical protein
MYSDFWKKQLFLSLYFINIQSTNPGIIIDIAAIDIFYEKP